MLLRDQDESQTRSAVLAWSMPASPQVNGKRGRSGPIAPAWSPLAPVAARPGGARLERNGVGLRCHSGMTGCMSPARSSSSRARWPSTT